jgi:hypothetical protein
MGKTALPLTRLQATLPSLKALLPNAESAHGPVLAAVRLAGLASRVSL